MHSVRPLQFDTTFRWSCVLEHSIVTSQWPHMEFLDVVKSLFPRLETKSRLDYGWPVCGNQLWLAKPQLCWDVCLCIFRYWAAWTILDLAQRSLDSLNDGGPQIAWAPPDTWKFSTPKYPQIDGMSTTNPDWVFRTGDQFASEGDLTNAQNSPWLLVIIPYHQPAYQPTYQSSIMLNNLHRESAVNSPHAVQHRQPLTGVFGSSYLQPGGFCWVIYTIIYTPFLS